MENQLATRPGLMPVLTIQDAVSRYNAVIEFTRLVMKPEKDFGTIPGTDKPTLLKPGAEKLCSLFGLAPTFEIVDKITDFDKPMFYLQYRCNLLSSDGRFMGSGIGSCNSHEKKYRYRSSERVCPNCGKSTIKKSSYPPRDNPNAKPGWYCHVKVGGCGANFAHNDVQITGQQLGQIENPDVADLANTIDKMAQKRALIAATLIVTNASEFFTQDLEDIEYTDATFRDAPATEQPKAEPAKALPVPEPTYPPEAGDVDREENEPFEVVPTRLDTLAKMLVEEKIVENDFHARGALKVLDYTTVNDAEAIKRVRIYRAWRDHDPKMSKEDCKAKALKGEEPK